MSLQPYGQVPITIIGELATERSVLKAGVRVLI